MLDPMTAVSLAGTIVQFLDFTIKVVSKNRKLSRSVTGVQQEVDSLEFATKDLLELSEKLKDGIRVVDANGTLSKNDLDFQYLCNACIAVSAKMLERLGKLKVETGDGKWRVAKQAIRTVWSEKELAELNDHVLNLRHELYFRILVGLDAKLDLATFSKQPVQDESLQSLIEALREIRYDKECVQRITRQQSHAITTSHQELRRATIDEHEITRDVIIAALTKAFIDSRGDTRQNLDLSEDKDNVKDPEVKKSEVEDYVLQSLLFPSITARYLQLTQAHQSTFKWIFEEPDSINRPWSSFTNWLQSGSGIYWINGKAGSGKSTLMKYIYDHHRTREMLLSWSEAAPVVIAGFFFWNSGTSLQKSQVGLLRSLLHEILSKHRNLIPLILPDHWANAYGPWGGKVTYNYGLFKWDMEKLEKAFELLRMQTQFRICLFIDGLDEYEGDRDGTYFDIVALFRDMASSSNIKICLSSRPWLVFQDAFRSQPTLRLQDLTLSDITCYVNDKLNSHERMTRLYQTDPANTKDLVQEIVSKSSGVFLWVVLAVKSLLDGLTNRDRILDLQRRLKLLPPELEDLYAHMLWNHINPFYHQQASQLFRLVRAAKVEGDEHLELLMLVFADEEYQDFVFETEVKRLTSDELRFRCNEMGERLQSRCAGLLEVSDYDASSMMRHYPRGLQVNYLHRTVQDFLYTPRIWDFILTQTEPNYDPYERLLEASVLRIKLAEVPDSRSECFDFLNHLVRNALSTARSSSFQKSYLSVLDELDKAATVFWESLSMKEKGSPRWSGIYWLSYENPLEHDNFFSLAIKYRLTSYIRASLEQDDGSIKKRGLPLLGYAIGKRWHEVPHAEIAFLLFKNGADPNESFQGQSMWGLFISRVYELWEENLLEDGKSLIRTFELFLTAGADPQNLSRLRIGYNPMTESRNRPFRRDPYPPKRDLCSLVNLPAHGRDLSKDNLFIASPLSAVSSSGPIPDTTLEQRLKALGARDVRSTLEIKWGMGETFQAATDAAISRFQAGISEGITRGEAGTCLDLIQTLQEENIAEDCPALVNTEVAQDQSSLSNSTRRTDTHIKAKSKNRRSMFSFLRNKLSRIGNST